jgi:hypothetical protein
VIVTAVVLFLLVVVPPLLEPLAKELDRASVPEEYHIT